MAVSRAAKSVVSQAFRTDQQSRNRPVRWQPDVASQESIKNWVLKAACLISLSGFVRKS